MVEWCTVYRKNWSLADWCRISHLGLWLGGSLGWLSGSPGTIVKLCLLVNRMWLAGNSPISGGVHLENHRTKYRGWPPTVDDGFFRVSECGEHGGRWPNTWKTKKNINCVRITNGWWWKKQKTLLVGRSTIASRSHVASKTSPHVVTVDDPQKENQPKTWTWGIGLYLVYSTTIVSICTSCMNMHMNIYIYICVHIYTCVCMYVCIYIYIYMYIYIYVCIHMNISVNLTFSYFHLAREHVESLPKGSVPPLWFSWTSCASFASSFGGPFKKDRSWGVYHVWIIYTYAPLNLMMMMMMMMMMMAGNWWSLFLIIAMIYIYILHIYVYIYIYIYVCIYIYHIICICICICVYIYTVYIHSIYRYVWKWSIPLWVYRKNYDQPSSF